MAQPCAELTWMRGKAQHNPPKPSCLKKEKWKQVLGCGRAPMCVVIDLFVQQKCKCTFTVYSAISSKLCTVLQGVAFSILNAPCRTKVIQRDSLNKPKCSKHCFRLLYVHCCFRVFFYLHLLINLMKWKSDERNVDIWAVTIIKHSMFNQGQNRPKCCCLSSITF